MLPRFIGDQRPTMGRFATASSWCGPELVSLRDRITQAFHGVMDTHLMTGQVCQAQCILSKETLCFSKDALWYRTEVLREAEVSLWD